MASLKLSFVISGTSTLAGLGMLAGEHGCFLVLIFFFKITNLVKSSYLNCILRGCQWKSAKGYSSSDNEHPLKCLGKQNRKRAHSSLKYKSPAEYENFLKSKIMTTKKLHAFSNIKVMRALICPCLVVQIFKLLPQGGPLQFTHTQKLYGTLNCCGLMWKYCRGLEKQSLEKRRGQEA